jgi:hypothetical protein
MKTPFLPVNSIPFLFCLFALLFLSSCKKDEGTVPNSWPSCQVIKTYDAAQPTTYTTFQYNADKKPLEWSAFSQGKETNVKAFEYNAQGQLIKTIAKFRYFSIWVQKTVEEVDTIKFEYNTKGQIAKYVVVHVDTTNLLGHQSTYSGICEYDAEGNRTKIIQTSPTSTEPYVCVFTYQGGNCIKAVYGQGLSYESSEEFEYDLNTEDKAQFFNDSFVQYTILGHSVNKNIIKKIDAAYKQNSNQNATIGFSYEFNQKGFPTKYRVVFTATNVDYTSSSETVLEYNCN